MKEDKQDHSGSIDFDPSSITTPMAGDGVMPSPTGSEFLYQSGGLNAEIAEQARQRGFIRVHKLVDAMAECAGWGEALPRVYRHLCCHKLPGAPETTEGSDRRGVWYEIMRVLMSDLQVNWLDIDPTVVPPAGLQPYEYVDGRFTPAIRKPHHEFFQHFVNLAEFKAYMEVVSRELGKSMPLPEALFPLKASDAPKKPRPVQRHTEEARRIAEIEWKKDPHKSLTDVVKHIQKLPRNRFDRKEYTVNTITEWIRDLNPAYSPGNPGRKGKTPTA